MIQTRINLPDDRGTHVLRAAAGELYEAGVSPDSIGLPSTRAIKPKTRRFEQTQYHWTEAASTAILLPMLFLLPVLAEHLGISRWASLAPAILVAFVVHRVLNRAWNKRYTKQYEAKLKDNSMCPSCVHDLSGLTPDVDGCTVCPECGAAWKLPQHENKNEPHAEARGSG